MSSSTNTSTDSSTQSTDIVEVFADNFVSEIKRIGLLLEEFPYVGMDTEFPGVVYPLTEYTQDFYYQSLKLNVDSLKLIQLGITLSDANGNLPKGTHTWQFNLKFNIKKDKISPESLSLLHNCGINFDTLCSNGIDHLTFAEYLVTSGLVLNQDVHWISFHGSFDFAYLLRLLLNDALPEKEHEFTSQLMLYFPNHYDIRIICSGNDKLVGGLNRVAQSLQVKRIGEVHQAGSDAFVTINVFHKIRKDKVVDKDTIDASGNILFGLGLGADDNETIQYTKFIAPPQTLMQVQTFPMQTQTTHNNVNAANINNQNIINYQQQQQAYYQMQMQGGFYIDNNVSYQNAMTAATQQQHHHQLQQHHQQQQQHHPFYFNDNRLYEKQMC